MRPKILFLDLDGTLLNDQKRISPENQQAVHLALSRGHKVVIASGRPLKSALIQAESIGLDGPGCFLIAYNGAVIYDCSGKRELFRRTLDMDDLYQLFDEANRRKIYIQTYDNNDVLLESRNDSENARRYCLLTDMTYRVIDNVRTDLPEPPPKALMIDFNGRMKTEPMRQWIAANMAGKIDAFFSGQYYLEAVAAGQNKGRAVLDVCKLLNFSPRDTIAAGDEANDISMLRTAGLGAAMKNALPEVKAAAGYVTRRDNNHDGVAEIIYHYLLE